MHHRRSALIVFSVLVALVALPANGAARSSHASGCAARMTFLLWPHGHAAIPALGFAKLPTPHTEIYKAGDTGYPNGKFLAWVAAGTTSEPSPSTTPACLSFASLPKTLEPLGTLSVIARSAAVTCTFPASGSIDIQHVTGGKYRYRIRIVLAGGRLAAQTDVTPAGVKLHYPAKLCQIAPPPAP